MATEPADAAAAAAAANTPATSPNPPPQPNPPTTMEKLKSWGKRWGLPIAAGSGAAYVFGAPLLLGAAAGAGVKYVWNKWQAAK